MKGVMVTNNYRCLEKWEGRLRIDYNKEWGYLDVLLATSDPSPCREREAEPDALQVSDPGRGIFGGSRGIPGSGANRGEH